MSDEAIPEDVMARARSIGDQVTFGGYEQNTLLIARALQAEHTVARPAEDAAEAVGRLINEAINLAPQAGLFLKVRVEAAPSIRSSS